MSKRSDAQYALERAVWDNVDAGPKPKKKKKFKWFDTKTVFGRLSVVLAPILYVGFVIVGCWIGYGILGGPWGPILQVFTMIGWLLLLFLANGIYWVFTGESFSWVDRL